MIQLGLSGNAKEVAPLVRKTRGVAYDTIFIMTLGLDPDLK